MLLVYHLAWMYVDLGLPVVAADLDPQANLTSMFFDDESNRRRCGRTALMSKPSLARFSHYWRVRATSLRHTWKLSPTTLDCWWEIWLYRRWKMN